MDSTDMTNDFISQVIKNAIIAIHKGWFSEINFDETEIDAQVIDIAHKNFGCKKEDIVSKKIEAANKGDTVYVGACKVEEENIILQSIENAHKNDNVCEEPAKKIISNVCEAEGEEKIQETVLNAMIIHDTNEIFPQTIETPFNIVEEAEEENIIPQTIETAHKDDTVCEEAKKNVLDAREADTNEFIPQTVETAYSQMDAREDTTRKITLDDCEGEEENIVLQTTEISQRVDDPAKIIALDACEVGINQIISQIIEAALDAVLKSEDTSNEIILDVCKTLPEERNGRENDVTNDNELRLFPDIDTKTLELESEASFIVECSGIDDNMEIVKSTEVDSDDYKTCKNDDMIPSTEIISESTELIDEGSVNQVPGIHLGEQKLISEGSGIENVMPSIELTELPSDDQFYSNELLRRKGYIIQINGKIKRVLNLIRPTDPRNKYNIHCSGIPLEMTENELIPLLEKCGQVFELRMMEDADVVYVTYRTEKESENAIQLLNGRKVKGNTIKVEKHIEPTRLYVRPISVHARKEDVFHQFCNSTHGLDNVRVPYSREHENQNRGYCYLNYKTHELAAKAKKIISNMYYNGNRVYCDFSLQQPGQPNDPTQHPVGTDKTKEQLNETRQVKDFLTTNNNRLRSGDNSTTRNVGMDYTKNCRKLLMNNLRPGVTTTNLRAIFSIYGEITEVDKDNNWASVKFQNPPDAIRAFHNIDKNLLGGKNFEITQFFLRDNSRQGSFGKTDDSTSRSARQDQFTHLDGQRLENSNIVNRLSKEKTSVGSTNRPATIDRNQNRNNISTFNGVKGTPSRNIDKIFFVKN